MSNPLGLPEHFDFRVKADICEHDLVLDSDVPNCRYWYESGMECSGCLDNNYRSVGYAVAIRPTQAGDNPTTWADA